MIAFVRHGKAEPRGSKPDEERSLTSEGRREVEAIARIMPFKPSIIFTSPLKRAVETADIIAKVHGVEYRIAEELSPATLCLESMKKISGLSDKSVIVAHAPSIERVVSSLVGGGYIHLKAGGLAVVELEDIEAGAGRLELLIQPQIALKLIRE